MSSRAGELRPTIPPNEFLTPSDDEWIDSIGVGTEPVDGEETMRGLSWAFGSGQELDLAYCLASRSVSLRWTDNGIVRLSLFRESAWRIRTWSGHGEAHISIEFSSKEFAGTVTMQLLPEVCITDTTLYA